MSKLKIEFVPVAAEGDTWAIDVHVNDKRQSRVAWVDMNAGSKSGVGRVCRISGAEIGGWAGSKMQAEEGARQLNELLALGRLE